MRLIYQMPSVSGIIVQSSGWFNKDWWVKVIWMTIAQFPTFLKIRFRVIYKKKFKDLSKHPCHRLSTSRQLNLFLHTLLLTLGCFWSLPGGSGRCVTTGYDYWSCKGSPKTGWAGWSCSAAGWKTGHVEASTWFGGEFYLTSEMNLSVTFVLILLLHGGLTQRTSLLLCLLGLYKNPDMLRT